ncbi:mechanosensitive ion channel family protein [Pontibacter sp. HSC-14F20]|uniref:mechanosensitive ion channel family protein n=1 Tax=Pontibacter sp. HSC-14F20 TaxID=2864136 RepID=UPI001C734412|nr:mechanosensitive ion channel family protein [Pontibacter sp. HSC-14F20]MBX0331949.1 mechanosensitive ion channel family protein [Pontibacter sp. HSC-14F20]
MFPAPNSSPNIIKPGSIASLIWLAVILLCAIPVTGMAQEVTEPDSVVAAAPTWPEDSLGRRSPQGTVTGFIRAVADEDYDRAALYLNLVTANDTIQDGAAVAQALQRMLDQRSKTMPRSWISQLPEGDLDDNLPPNQERVGTATVDDQHIDILLEKTEGPAGGPVWLVAAETISKVPLQEVAPEETVIEKTLPGFLEDNRWGGVPAGHWMGYLLIAVAAYLLGWGMTSGLILLISYIWRKTRDEPTYGFIRAFSLPVRLYLAALLLVYLSQRLGISFVLRQRFSELTIIVGLIAVLLLLWRLVDVITNFSQRRLVDRHNMAGISIVLFLRRGAKIALVVLGVIFILDTLGFDVTTGLAALGIGGIALALGAQKTVENFVGSVTLIADQPIRVGDYCQVGDTSGTVEQIGMRSTRLRTTERTIVTIPNGDFSSQKIENFAHRDRFLFSPVLRLRYDTTPPQIQAVLRALRETLTSHPKIDKTSARVRLTEITADALKVEVFSYVLTNDFNEQLEIKEGLLLTMMDAVNTKGKGFALPVQQLLVSNDGTGIEQKNEKSS